MLAMCVWLRAIRRPRQADASSSSPAAMRPARARRRLRSPHAFPHAARSVLEAAEALIHARAPAKPPAKPRRRRDDTGGAMPMPGARLVPAPLHTPHAHARTRDAPLHTATAPVL